MPRSRISFAQVSAQVFITLALVIAVALIAPIADVAQAQASPPPLDHFRCYPLIFGPQPEIEEIVLQDQFDVFLGLDLTNDLDLLAFFLGAPNRFCNPVEKTVEKKRGDFETTPIGDPDAHLTLYRIFRQAVAAPALLAVPAVTWHVKVRNQFGEQKLDARRPVALAVPTQKHEDDLEFPENLDHFKCYDAKGKSVRRMARLEDQFETAIVTVLEPRLFCNPTRKVVAGGGASIGGTDHLVCYELRLVTTATFGFVSLEDRVISNQFTGSSTGDILAVTDEDLLCVPSRKVSFAPHKVRGPGKGHGHDDEGEDEEDEEEDD